MPLVMILEGGQCGQTFAWKRLVPWAAGHSPLDGPHIALPQYGPLANYQQPHLSNNFIPQLPNTGYLGALQYQHHQGGLITTLLHMPPLHFHMLLLHFKQSTCNTILITNCRTNRHQVPMLLLSSHLQLPKLESTTWQYVSSFPVNICRSSCTCTHGQQLAIMPPSWDQWICVISWSVFVPSKVSRVLYFTVPHLSYWTLIRLLRVQVEFQ